MLRFILSRETSHAVSMSYTRPPSKSRHSTSHYTTPVRVAAVTYTYWVLTRLLTPGGSPLSLEQIVASPLFRPQTLPSSSGNTFALTLPASSLSLLSQGDHPTLGTPSWYFHPCNTSEVMREILREMVDYPDGDGLRWMEAWFMIMGNVVDFFAGQVC